MVCRYLTKMCDQVVSLISSEHAQTIIWSEEDSEVDDTLEDSEDEDESGRIVDFEVAQTSEQEETVTVRKGFRVSSSWLWLGRSLTFVVQLQADSPAIALPKITAEDPNSMEPAPIAPFLLFGETNQGFMTVQYREAKVTREIFRGPPMQLLQLEKLL